MLIRFRHRHQATRVQSASWLARAGKVVSRISWLTIFEAGLCAAMLIAIFAGYGILELWFGR